MKEIAQKRNIALPQNVKKREVTVVRHYHPNPSPNPLRDVPGNFPKVRYFSELPEGNRYLHLHPVFKFVDSFLSSTSVNKSSPVVGRSSGTISKRKLPGKVVGRYNYQMPSNNTIHLSGDSSAKVFVTKRSSMPQQACTPALSKEKQDRIRTNIGYIGSKSDLRVSLKSSHCPNCRCIDEPSTSIATKKSDPCKSLVSVGTGSEYYVEQLKNEIRRSKLKFQHLNPKNDNEEYVNRLKEELMCKKTKCIQEARCIINELQNEILNYRLQAKVKYSSSCSDIDKASSSNAKLSCKNSGDCSFLRRKHEEKQDMSRPSVLDSPIREEAARYKPCETLWKTTEPLPSSSDLDAGSTSVEINFEEKLEEANSLIEKVRKALRDIGKSMYRLPDQKKSQSETEPTPQLSNVCSKKCIDMVCSFHGECPTEINETHEEKNNGEEVNFDQKSEIEKVNENEERQIETNDTREYEPNDDIREEPEVANEMEVMEDATEKSLKNEMEEMESTNETVTIKPASVDDAKDVSVVPFSASMQLLQDKLNTISETSETDVAIDKIFEVKQKKDATDSRVERGSSPINLTDSFLHSQEKFDPERIESMTVAEPGGMMDEKVQTLHEKSISKEFNKSVSSEKIYSPAETSMSDSSKSLPEANEHQNNAVANGKDYEDESSERRSALPEENRLGISTKSSEEVASTDFNKKISETSAESGKKISNRSSERSAKLSIQVMPPVNIRAGLVMQRTLNISIKPTGSVTNNLTAIQSNIGYQEITVAPNMEEAKTSSIKVYFEKCPEDCKNSTGYCKANDGFEKLANEKQPTDTAEVDRVQTRLGSVKTETPRVTEGEPSRDIEPRESRDKSHRESFAIKQPRLDPSGLNQDEIIVFRSFQILDDDKFNHVTSSTQNLPASPASSSLESDIVFRYPPGVTPEKPLAEVNSLSKFARETAKKHNQLSKLKFDASEDIDSIFKFIPSENLNFNKCPWEIGFYKTRSTQCSQTNLEDDSSAVYPASQVQKILVKAAQRLSQQVLSEKERTRTYKFSSTDDSMPKSSSIEISPRITSPVTTPGSGTEATSVTTSVSKEIRVPLDVRREKNKELHSDDSTSRSEVAVSQNLKSFQASQFKDTPVRDPRKSHQISMSDILSILNDGKETSILLGETEEKESVSSKVSGEESKRDGQISTSSGEESDDENDSKGKGKVVTEQKSMQDMSTSSTSSSSSSFNVHGSLSPSHSDDKTVPSPKAPVPPPVGASLSRQKSDVKPPRPDLPDSVKSPSEKKESLPSERPKLIESQPVPETGEKQPDKGKTNKGERKVEVEHEVSKESKPVKGTVKKKDAMIQVSLESSSESDSSSYSEQDAHDNTIKYFIKGLTGTSRDELAKLRSNPSIPKTDLPSYSRTILKTLQEHRPSLRNNRQDLDERSYEEAKEVVVDTHDYLEKSTVQDTKPPIPENASVETNLSEESKMKRLREFQRMAQGLPRTSDQGDKKDKEKIVMRIAAQRGDGDEGSNRSVHYSRRQLPFYRRVLGRIIDPSNKKLMRMSQSDANPIDESISEGEIKCMSSPSIGEIRASKYLNDRKKFGKSGNKYLKKHPDDVTKKELHLSDKSFRIARQRAQYNSWVTYYLQKHHNVSVGDDSSSSPVDSSKK